MLLALHASLAWGIDDWWPRAFLLAHFGLFLLWQPVWRGEREIEPRYAFLVVIVGVPVRRLEQLVADGGVAGGAVRPDRRLGAAASPTAASAWSRCSPRSTCCRCC